MGLVLVLQWLEAWSGKEGGRGPVWLVQTERGFLWERKCLLIAASFKLYIYVYWEDWYDLSHLTHCNSTKKIIQSSFYRGGNWTEFKGFGLRSHSQSIKEKGFKSPGSLTLNLPFYITGLTTCCSRLWCMPGYTLPLRRWWWPKKKRYIINT